MADMLKSKSFQPLAGVRHTGVFFRPDFLDPGQNCRLHNLYCKSVDPWWRLPIAPERCPGLVVDKPEPAGAGQCLVLIAQRIARHVARLPAETHLDEVRAAQEFEPHRITRSP